MLNAQGFPFLPERFASFGNGWKSLRGSLWLSSAHVLQPDPQALALQEEQQLCHQSVFGEDCKRGRKLK